MNISSQAKRALVVFSGGQDSTTCLYWALKHFEKVRTLTFDYGQRHRIELECAKKIAQFAAVPHEVLSVGTFAELGGNALTGSEEVEAHQENIIEEGLPNTFVPRRNIILLSFAAARAWQLGIENIVTGVCQTDYSGYPDCKKHNRGSAISAKSGHGKTVCAAYSTDVVNQGSNRQEGSRAGSFRILIFQPYLLQWYFSTM